MDYLRFKRPKELDPEASLSPFSDLFALLSFVFLLLYVMGTLQAGVLSIARQAESQATTDDFRQKLEATIAAYEKRIATYEVEKEAYLAQHGTTREVENYQQILGKLYLLRQEARGKHEELSAEARQYARREKELEGYRTMIQDMARSNLVTKSRMLTSEARIESQIREEYRERLSHVSTSNQSRMAELKARYQEDIKAARAKNTSLRQELVASQQRQTKLRESIASRLSKEFAQAGVTASVDPQTGEVTIAFAEVHFDYDSDALKPQMRDTLRKAIPAYARALLGDTKIRKSIASLEVVGFASPTYLGKYVEPGSLDWRGKKGVNYNMDLSYRRAKAIFEFVFDAEAFRFPLQSRMLRMTKVSGVSHLQSTPVREPASRKKSASPKAKKFCETYDCAAHQKVVLRFNLKEQEQKP